MEQEEEDQIIDELKTHLGGKLTCEFCEGTVLQIALDPKQLLVDLATGEVREGEPCLEIIAVQCANCSQSL